MQDRLKHQKPISENGAVASNALAAMGPEDMARVAGALARLRYGEIRLSIHDGRLVQMDVTERTRFGLA